jgi:predicted nucleotidyltransferase
MVIRKNPEIISRKIKEYIKVLKANKIKIWRMYLYGSYAKNTWHKDSDIDLAIFLAQDELDGFEEDATLMKLRRRVDTRIEPHIFAKPDFEMSNPYIAEIIQTGKRII